MQCPVAQASWSCTMRARSALRFRELGVDAVQDCWQSPLLGLAGRVAGVDHSVHVVEADIDRWELRDSAAG
jgi:hypothetical protein